SPGVVIPIQPWGGTTQMFWDSDLGKSIETIAYSLYRRPNPKLEARADEIIDMYEKMVDLQDRGSGLDARLYLRSIRAR
ncbi:beta-L-arabinofuranosidase domain-containing protein, partial [Rhizobium johnstonii]|uniref:beta-L-arabinofuranosidase domain-containing protein n=1 Tax=Rhizobium johnstonii TaxID=3019933 RepID=UPI003F9AA315